MATAKKTPAKKAAAPKLDKKAQKDSEKVSSAVLSTLITLFLDKPHITPASLSKLPQSPEAALCLTLIGGGGLATNEIGIAMSLRGAYDRADSAKLAMWGVAELRGQKLANWTKRPKPIPGVAPEPTEFWDIELTAKGQKLYDRLRSNMLKALAK